MTIITETDEEMLNWHESIQVLLVLNRRPLLNRATLYQEVAKKQKEIISDYERSTSTCTCRYWVNSHLNDGKIRELGSLLELTPLGKWIVNSSAGTMWDRESFVNNCICLGCRPFSMVLYKLDLDSATTNKKGDIFMNAECPRCHKSIHRYKVADRTFDSLEKFLQFYNNAKNELFRIEY